jgi:hypothetical protein
MISRRFLTPFFLGMMRMRIRTRRLQLPTFPTPQCRPRLPKQRLPLRHKLQSTSSQSQKTLIPRIPTRIRMKDIKEMARACMIRIIPPMLLSLPRPNKSLRAPESRKMGEFFSVFHFVQSWIFPLYFPLYCSTPLRRSPDVLSTGSSEWAQ